MNSPGRSPPPEADSTAPPPPPQKLPSAESAVTALAIIQPTIPSEREMSSHGRAPEAESAAPPPPSAEQAVMALAIIQPTIPSEREMSPPRRSPLPEAESASPPPPPQKLPSAEPGVTALALADRRSQDDLATVVSIVGCAGGGSCISGEGAQAGNGVCVSRKENGFGAVPRSLRRRAVMRVAFGLRVSAALLCLVSFSVMAADSTPGWAGDSFDRYREYQYLVCVNAIAFVYSAFQAYTKVHHSILKKFIIPPPISFYFDLSMDQVLAYLLISASSIAASRNDLWVSRFGRDEFIDMANGSIAISFLAFAVLALSSLISTHNLFRWSSSSATSYNGRQ
ncbi:CASP-like protein 4A3 [Canna indica]|uniref:CASP-like protein n=1 Tax=Canna indica TaxID=4628 RepID=A0AAQ3QJ06_9LILI|nr:CASP-like protein 4A3 [Canna indica]